VSVLGILIVIVLLFAAYRLGRNYGWKAVGGGIAALFAFLVPLFLGAYYYYMGAQKDAEVAALNMLRAHEELASNHPDLASEIPANKAKRVKPSGLFTPAYVRLGTDALFTDESIYTLVGMDPSPLPRWLEKTIMPGRVERVRTWDAAVIDLAELNDTFVLSYDFRCGEYDQRFIAFLKENTKRFESICPARKSTDQRAIEKLTDAAKAQESFRSEHGYYTAEIANLVHYDGFKQGTPGKDNPPVRIKVVIMDKEKTAYDESYYCMQSPSGKAKYTGAYKYFRITPYDDHPIPGSCGTGSPGQLSPGRSDSPVQDVR
jgi:hypothetical protein